MSGTLEYKLQQEYRIDAQTIHECMKQANGVKSLALKLLRDSGVDIPDSTFYETLKSHPVLKAVWGDAQSSVVASVPDTIVGSVLPAAIDRGQRAAINSAMLTKEEAYIAANGMADMDLSDSEIAEALGYIRFSATNRMASLSMAHGATAFTQLEVRRRMKYIEDHYLTNDETAIGDDGKPCKVVTNAEKIRWQQEYTALAVVLSKMTDTLFEAAGVMAQVDAIASSKEDKQMHRAKVVT